MTGDPTVTRTEVETKGGVRPVYIVEWDHSGGGRGAGSRGRHRAVILAEPGEGECPTCGAMANPKGAHGFAPDGSLFCPGWPS